MGRMEIPDSFRKTVFLDANAYRNLVSDLELSAIRQRVRELVSREATAGILPVAIPTVVWELAMHLADPDDPAYGSCLNALLALAEHTWSRFPDREGIIITMDGEWAVCDALFGSTPTDAEALTQSLSRLANHIRLRDADVSDPAVQENICFFRNEGAAREESFKLSLKGMIRRLDPGFAKDWIGGDNSSLVRTKLRKLVASEQFINFWAEAGVLRYAEIAGVNVSGDDLPALVSFYRKNFVVAFCLLRKIIVSLLHSKPNIDSRKRKWGNYLWDNSMCHLIGPEFAKGVSGLLVTDDRAIHDAANEAGNRDTVATLQSYLVRVGFSGNSSASR